jgi:hypothetical protein
LMRGCEGFSSNWGWRMVYRCSSEKFAPCTWKHDKTKTWLSLRKNGRATV